MIELDRVSLSAGKFSLRDISLSVPTGVYGVLMGKTGTGKTTLLEVICRLRNVEAGTVRLFGQDIARLSPGECQVGYVPQDLALFPRLTVREHLEFALTIRHDTPAALRARVQELSTLLGIEHLLTRYPAKLSGGEAQRVALGRALSFRPRVLLLDEPLSALDEETRHDMYELLRRVQRETEVTTLHITHSPLEASALAQQLFRLENGQVTPVTR
jgi:ABC-type sugar transport system ATPase subunit